METFKIHEKLIPIFAFPGRFIQSTLILPSRPHKAFSINYKNLHVRLFTQVWFTRALPQTYRFKAAFLEPLTPGSVSH